MDDGVEALEAGRVDRAGELAQELTPELDRPFAFALIKLDVEGMEQLQREYGGFVEELEKATGFDHIVYGWVFFAIVIAILLGAAWRFVEREPEDYGWSLGGPRWA